MGKYEDECYYVYFDFLGEVDKRPKNINVVMSKRQLNIAKEAEKRYLGRPEHQYYSAEDLAMAFRDGAEWADNNPVNAWHSINEEPNIDEDVVLFDSCGNFVTEFYNGDVTWNNIVLFHKATMWAYKDDLLPKQFGNSKQLKGE